MLLKKKKIEKKKIQKRKIFVFYQKEKNKTKKRVVSKPKEETKIE